jgi:hypothetical protein
MTFVTDEGTESFEHHTYPPADFSCVNIEDIYAAQRRAAFEHLSERLMPLFGFPVEPNTACPHSESKPRG